MPILKGFGSVYEVDSTQSSVQEERRRNTTPKRSSERMFHVSRYICICVYVLFQIRLVTSVPMEAASNGSVMKA